MMRLVTPLATLAISLAALTPIAHADTGGLPLPSLPPTPTGGAALFGTASQFSGAGQLLGSGYSDKNMVTADFNGDGIPDVAVVDPTHGVNVTFGLGQGRFGSTQPYAAGTGSMSVAAVDLRGTGKPDLVVANALSADLTVLLNNGDGTFTKGASYPTGIASFAITVGDFNGDGRPDVAVANPGSSTISVLLSDGDGTLRAAPSIPTSAGVTTLVAADFNHDGHIDLGGAGTPSAMLGASGVSAIAGIVKFTGNGDGTFRPGYATSATGFYEGITAGDVNGDGLPDLIGANAYTGNLDVYESKASGGFAVPISSAAFLALTGVVSGAFCGTTHLDLAAIDDAGNQVSILCGDGTGAFTVRERHSVTFQPQTVVSADLNHDGRPDLVISGSTQPVSVLIHQ